MLYAWLQHKKTLHAVVKQLQYNHCIEYYHLTQSLLYCLYSYSILTFWTITSSTSLQGCIGLIQSRESDSTVHWIHFGHASTCICISGAPAVGVVLVTVGTAAPPPNTPEQTVKINEQSYLILNHCHLHTLDGQSCFYRKLNV